MVEIGGEVVCAGAKTGGRPWQIGIEKPDGGSGRPIQEVVELRDRALATSGDYRNFFESGGHRVHHVIDARTGRNADNGVVQVSVLAPDCTLADGLATAWMIVGPDAARELLARPELAGVDALFLLRDPDGGVRELRVPERSPTPPDDKK
jgi:thiamine biosynthesis lipoprotein